MICWALKGLLEKSVIYRISSAWKNFQKLLSLLTSRCFSIEVKGRLYKVSVRSVICTVVSSTSLGNKKSKGKLRIRLAARSIRDVYQIRRLS